MSDKYESIFILLAGLLSLTGLVTMLAGINVDQGMIWNGVAVLLWIVLLARFTSDKSH